MEYGVIVIFNSAHTRFASSQDHINVSFNSPANDTKSRRAGIPRRLNSIFASELFSLWCVGPNWHRPEQAALDIHCDMQVHLPKFLEGGKEGG